MEKKITSKTREELEVEFKELKKEFVELSSYGEYYDDVYLALFEKIEELFYNILKSVS